MGFVEDTEVKMNLWVDFFKTVVYFLLEQLEEDNRHLRLGRLKEEQIYR